MKAYSIQCEGMFAVKEIKKIAVGDAVLAKEDTQGVHFVIKKTTNQRGVVVT